MRKLRLGPVIVCLLVLGLIGTGYCQVAQANTTGKNGMKAGASKEAKAEKETDSADKKKTSGSKDAASAKKDKSTKLSSKPEKKKTKKAHASKSVQKKGKVAKSSGGKGKSRSAVARSKGKHKSHKVSASSKRLKMDKGKNKRHARRHGKARTLNVASHVRPISDYQPPSPRPSDLWLARECPDIYRQMANEGQPQELTMKILESAYSCLGAPYRHGGTTPDGFDCSGFVRYIYKENGINLGRSSRDQAHYGKPVELSELKPGDLIFFKMNQRRRSSSASITWPLCW
jgi:cell wall-associated NlpC family hydrolase